MRLDFFGINEFPALELDFEPPYLFLFYLLDHPFFHPRHRPSKAKGGTKALTDPYILNFSTHSLSSQTRAILTKPNLFIEDR